MLAVEAIDYHPLLIGAKIQSIPVCRASVDCWVGILNGDVTPITPVQSEVPSWSGASLRLTAYEHGLTESKSVGMTGWMHLDLEVWITHAHMMPTSVLQIQPGLTCHIEPDGLGGGPSPKRLVCLKPEVVVARITQLHDPNLERAA